MVWGVRPILVPLTQDTDEMIEIVLAAAIDGEYVKAGDTVVVTSGRTSRESGETDFIVVRKLK
jgi:pyruvate kinase